MQIELPSHFPHPVALAWTRIHHKQTQDFDSPFRKGQRRTLAIKLSYKIFNLRVRMHLFRSKVGGFL